MGGEDWDDNWKFPAPKHVHLNRLQPTAIQSSSSLEQRIVPKIFEDTKELVVNQG